jgi:hypothetical protein
MPSQYSNLNFSNKYDIATWKEKCAEQRKIALMYPAYDLRMSGVEEYGWTIGPWSVRLVLEVWKKPYLWHASAAIIEHIGYETVTVNDGLYRGSHLEVPQDALLSIASWHLEHHEQSRFLMAEMLGEYLKAGDKHQPAEERDGLWCKHWRLRYDGPKVRQEKQH